MITLLLKVLLSYLIGSISGSLLVGRFKGVDIRKLGSGNAGGTNAFRTQGIWFALAVVIIDISKGALAAGYISGLVLLTTPDPFAAVPMFAPVMCGAAAVLGHIFPVFHHFKGGKGAATFVGALCVVMPIAVAPVFLIWVTVLVIWGYVGLSTILAALSFVPLVYWLSDEAVFQPLMGFALFTALLMVWTHRENIQRLLAGSENRFEKVRLSYWLLGHRNHHSNNDGSHS